jgi:hypothetical protein
MKFILKQREKINKFIIINHEFSMTHIKDENGVVIPFSTFVTQRIDQKTLEEIAFDEVCFNKPNSKEEFKTTGKLTDYIGTLVEQPGNKVIGITYYSQIKNPFPSITDNILTWFYNPDSVITNIQYKIDEQNIKKTEEIQTETYILYTLLEEKYAERIIKLNPY